LVFHSLTSQILRLFCF